MTKMPLGIWGGSEGSRGEANGKPANCTVSRVEFLKAFTLSLTFHFDFSFVFTVNITPEKVDLQLVVHS
jgi:hypothetical protein